jgi:GNAT superfamily N-acetyltransferase
MLLVVSHPPVDSTDPRNGAALPAGFALVAVRTTHLEMLENAVPVAPETPPSTELERLVRPPLDEYRALFLAVGGQWGWTGRLLMTDGQLADILGDDRIEVWRLRSNTQVAGFVELCRRKPGEVEILYFGLTPGFIGRGLGGFMLRWAINHAWTTVGPGPDSPSTKRLWLHTCDFDSPVALPFYKKAGFVVFNEEEGLEAYPEAHIARRRPGGQSPTPAPRSA